MFLPESSWLKNLNIQMVKTFRRGKCRRKLTCIKYLQFSYLLYALSLCAALDRESMYTQSTLHTHAHMHKCIHVGCYHVHVKMQSVFRYSRNEIKPQEKKTTCRACLKPNNEDTVGFFLWRAFPFKRKQKKRKHS